MIDTTTKPKTRSELAAEQPATSAAEQPSAADRLAAVTGRKPSKAELRALASATTVQSLRNYPVIFDFYAARGIATDDIDPQKNVLTFKAWKALGRVPRKPDDWPTDQKYGCTIAKWQPFKKKNKEGSEERAGYWRDVTVFHVSQTVPLD